MDTVDAAFEFSALLAAAPKPTAAFRYVAARDVPRGGAAVIDSLDAVPWLGRHELTIGKREDGEVASGRQ